MVLKGAEILLYPTAIGSEPQNPALNSFPHWQRVMLGHAAANLVRLHFRSHPPKVTPCSKGHALRGVAVTNTTSYRIKGNETVLTEKVTKRSNRILGRPVTCRSLLATSARAGRSLSFRFNDRTVSVLPIQ
eukprot:3843015-Pyramimonas_sp.AAC.1